MDMTNIQSEKQSTFRRQAQRRSALPKEMAYQQRQLAGYAEMLKIAAQYGMEWEMDRIPQCVREIEDDIENMREEAITLGFGPDDL